MYSLGVQGPSFLHLSSLDSYTLSNLNVTSTTFNTNNFFKVHAIFFYVTREKKRDFYHELDLLSIIEYDILFLC